MITTFYPPFNTGGDGVFVRNLSRELAERGHTVHVIHCQDSYRLLQRREPPGEYDDPSGVTVHGLSNSWAMLSPLLTHQLGRPVLNARRIRGILAAGFDVLHFHNVSLVGGPGILYYGNAIKLYTLHEYWLVCPTHLLFRFGREPCERRTCFLCSLSYLRPPQIWRSWRRLRAATAQVDTFIAPSRFIAQKHRDWGLDLPVQHLPHFTPRPNREASTPDGTTEPYFLFVGRLEKVKGLQTLIPVFRRLSAARLLVVGEGAYGRHLRALAEGSSNIRFLGSKSGDELTRLYRQATALVVPSLCFENLGLVVLEALALGTPAIVRRSGGLPEMIESNDCGVIYSSDAELVDALQRLQSDSSFRADLGSRALLAYERNWTPEIHLDRYLGLIERLASRRAI